jgi:hypothetical protein
MIRLSQLFGAFFVTSTLLSAAAVAREPNEPPRREDRREDRQHDRSGRSGHDNSGRENHESASGHGQRGPSHD